MAGVLKICRAGTTVWRGICTAASPAASTATEKKENDGTVLFGRLTALGHSSNRREAATSGAKVADVLDEWVSQGNPIRRALVISFASQLRRFKKPHIALQLYQWMERNKKKLKNADRALCIDLIYKTEGIASAEKYFNALEEPAKTKKTYGSLLNCYCQEKMLDQATQLFEKMAHLNFHANALHYNNLMSLYNRVGMPEKVPQLFKEMQEKGIVPDLYAYNLLMNSYASPNDIDAAEGVFEQLKSSKIHIDWFTLGNLATIYFNAGLKDKATAALEELEKMKLPKNSEAFHTLMNLYSHLSNAAGVARAWELCKSKFMKPNNLSYLIMHLALSRLGDYDELEKLFKEWESCRSNYDARIPNVVLESYLKRDMIEEASLLYESIARSGANNRNLRTHNSLMDLFLKKREINLALQTLEAGASKATSQQQNNWFPRQESVNEFVRYLVDEKDTVSATKFLEIMKKINRVDAETEKILNEVCASVG